MNQAVASHKKGSTFDGPKKTLLTIVVIAIVGWLDAAYALWHRQSLFANGLVKKSFCNVNATVDCDSVAFSSYSAILGIPTAAYGMFFSAVILVLAVLAYFAAQDQREDDLQTHAKQLFALSAFALIPTFLLAGVSAFKLGTLCIICLITYLVNLALFYFSWKLKGFFPKRSSAPLWKITPVLGWSVVVLLGLHLLSPKMVNGMVATQTSMDEKMIRLLKSQFANETAQTFDLALGASYGPENAAVTIVEFSDFQCPYCAVSARTMPSFLKAYQGRVRYVFKFYPLDSACNAKMPRAVHPLACHASKLGHCVRVQKGNDAFFLFKDAVFAKQSTMSKDSLLADAVAAGGTDAELKSCLDAPETQQAVVAQVTEGVAAKVEGTPSIFVNGRRVEGGPNPQVLSRILEDYIK